MKLILGGINGEYLRNITENSARDTEEVWAAVAYATQKSLLFDWCWEKKIPLKFYGRLDDDVAVNPSILRDFLKRKSSRYVCCLVEHHHAKVIWWRGVGVYIGSANLTDKAWHKNVEAGCFFLEDEIDSAMNGDLRSFFKTLEENGTPLNEELLSIMEQRKTEIDNKKPNSDDFWQKPSIRRWNGLVTVAPAKAQEKNRKEFLAEWHSTLQHLRDIATQVSLPENRPSWVDASASSGMQADQFLHAYYYQRRFVGLSAKYEENYENNKERREEALTEAIDWWRGLSAAPDQEDKKLNEVSEYMQQALSEDSLAGMEYSGFEEICRRVHATEDYARRVANKIVGLRTDGTNYQMDEKIEALSKKIWNSNSSSGEEVKKLLTYLLYGGNDHSLPERLWEAVQNPNWKVEGLGISALGEIIGWAMPDKFPPRNGRTSKALRSLGYDVEVHV
ncbi:MAG: phospholipase D-like domain-containing protein [Rhodospirillales bacterium]